MDIKFPIEREELQSIPEKNLEDSGQNSKNGDKKPEPKGDNRFHGMKPPLVPKNPPKS